ncbi:MAG: UDP-N-acetylglucosamine 1-carboxyvinyltransferase [Candidatus Blackburnbacteria bacterium]|nr:UDP-N-acetylglucosamine 1-carboxyvinyltransferase [Candidatus Blackburnbacteria bacterium]
MARLEIAGGTKLKGKVKVGGNKNSMFGLMSAALLANSSTKLTNSPRIRDVEVMVNILKSLGCRVEYDHNGEVLIDNHGLSSSHPDEELAGRIRGSVVLAAPLLVRFGEVEIPRPSGDSIGERLLDTHINVLSSFGAKTRGNHSSYIVKAEKLHGANIFLEEASVTATEMALITASAISEETIIEGAAAEPHVVDLEEMLLSMGAKIEGKGSNIVRIKGARKLKGVEHRVRPEHIEVGTFAIASAITNGDIEIEDALAEDLKMILAYLSKMGVSWEFKNANTLHIKPSRLVARQKKFHTRPWPGFPTDLMSQFIVLATQTEGTVLCHDWMYEWRIFFVDHLIDMGANIIIADPHRVIVTGPRKFHGDIIPSPDIRAGGALVLAALAAEGKSTVEHAEVIERGYEDFDGKLRSLGAKIERIV